MNGKREISPGLTHLRAAEDLTRCCTCHPQRQGSAAHLLRHSDIPALIDGQMRYIRGENKGRKANSFHAKSNTCSIYKNRVTRPAAMTKLASHFLIASLALRCVLRTMDRRPTRYHSPSERPPPQLGHPESRSWRPVQSACRPPDDPARWLENGPGKDARRGRDEFVAVNGIKHSDLVAAELKRRGCPWSGRDLWFIRLSSAGRFHHAQSQVHRFLNFATGGYVRLVNTYSSGAASVILAVRHRRLRGGIPKRTYGGKTSSPIRISFSLLVGWR